MTENDFIDFLKKKKIHADLLKKSEPEMYQNWLNTFIQSSPASFDQQKKFLFNAYRKKYPLTLNN
ncbi:MAG: hypothetical protein KatS3mg035_0296 [Bacteroidia bacterium]|nr:MAG: hypothetical protein KatS3mg035_0296 [Bacteroidia bacterium]